MTLILSGIQSLHQTRGDSYRASIKPGAIQHLGIGRAHARTEIICLIHNLDAAVITNDGLILAEFTLNPAHDYQRKNG